MQTVAKQRCPYFGFTLIEMLVTVALVGILASVMVPIAQLEIQRNKEAQLRKGLDTIRDAIDEFKEKGDQGHISRNATTAGYPESLAQLVQGVEDIKDPNKKKIYFLRRIPRDPMNTDTQLSAEQTWGLRSYTSDADNPQYENDVYDIYSLSDQKGLNGIPYKEW